MPGGVKAADWYEEADMKWTTPAYSDLRFGFEITMYILNK